MVSKNKACALLLALLVLTCASLVNALTETKSYIVVYGSQMCPACTSLKNFLDNEGLPYVFLDLVENREYASLFYELISTVGLKAYVPTSAVICGGRVVAVVQGAILDREFWLSLISGSLAKENTLQIWYFTETGLSVKEVTNKTIIETVNSIVLETASNHEEAGEAGFGMVFPVLLSLAVADSLNPCAMVFLAIIVTSIAFTSKARKYATALAYVLGVYTSYFLIGMGVSFVLELSRFLLVAVAIFGYGFVLFNMFSSKTGLLRGFADSLKRKIIVKMVSEYSIPLSFIVGGLMAITFMMCSSAPYFVFLAYLSKNVKLFYEKIAYIAIYNAVIIVPLILTAVASTYVTNYVSRKHVTTIRNILIITVSTYALYTIIAT